MAKKRKVKGKSRVHIDPKPGDIIRLHKDFHTIPAGRYTFLRSVGPVLHLACGDSFVGIDRRSVGFCSVEQGELTREEIFVTQTRMIELIEQYSTDSAVDIGGGKKLSISRVGAAERRAMEFDA